MASIKQKVKILLAEYFETSEVNFDRNPDGRVSALIVSKKFIKVDDLKRQQIIWSLLRDKVSAEERMKIIGFLAFTPAEYKAYRTPSL